MSTWYAAHLIMYVRYKHGKQTVFPVWENIVLIRAASEDEAFAKAEERAQLDVGDDDGSFRWDGNPAEWIFAGVRKLTTCVNPERRPGDGTEVTYIEMELPSLAAVRKLAAGNSVIVKLDDPFPSEPEETSVPGNGRRKFQSHQGTPQ